MQYLGFGNGSDGSATLSGTDAPIDSSCSGTAAATSLSATNASFAAGKIILIHQSRGTGVGSWEFNFIDSYVAGTITTQFPLVNTYTDSGNSQAQVLQLKEYSDVTISGTFTAKTWNGDVGGIIAFLCNGPTVVSGTLTAAACGFAGGAGTNGGTAYCGEGEVGDTTPTSLNNGSGGGGGKDGSGEGSDGVAFMTDNTLATRFVFGGGGGGCAGNGGTGGTGGRSGGIIFIHSNTFTVTGSVSVNGQNGTSRGAGGAGAGIIYIRCIDASIGTGLMTAAGGLGAAGNSGDDGGGGGAGATNASGTTGQNGTNGTAGLIRIESCAPITGSSTPSAVTSDTGQDWCQSFIHVHDN